MFVPITQEVTIEKGTVLKEISTGKLFQASKRQLTNPDASGEPVWEIADVESNKERRTLGYLQIVKKYFAQVED